MKVTKVDVTVTGLIDGMAVQLSVNEVEGLTPYALTFAFS